MKANRSIQDVAYLCTKLGGNVRQMHKSSLLSISSGYKLQCYQLEESTFSDFGHGQRKASWETFLIGQLQNTNRFNEFRLLAGQIPYGLAVRIPGFHPGGPGSTPGMGTAASFFFFLFSLKKTLDHTPVNTVYKS